MTFAEGSAKKNQAEQLPRSNKVNALLLFAKIIINNRSCLESLKQKEVTLKNNKEVSKHYSKYL